MALLELPTRTDLPGYRYTVRLDGTDYILGYRFNTRMDKWLMSVSDVTGALLIADVPLVADWPLIDRFRVPGQPPGSLVAYDTSGQGLDPGRFDLGDRVRMTYLPEADQ